MNAAAIVQLPLRQFIDTLARNGIHLALVDGRVVAELAPGYCGIMPVFVAAEIHKRKAALIATLAATPLPQQRLREQWQAAASGDLSFQHNAEVRKHG